jgi:CHAT domain-containing protein/tetratricopeptide (TPR) repeat protein
VPTINHRPGLTACSLWFITIWLICLTAPQAAAQSADEVALRALVDKFFAAYQNKDIDAMMSLWSPKSPDLAFARKEIEATLATLGKIKVNNLVVRRVTAAGTTATVQMSAQVDLMDARAPRQSGGPGKLNRTFHFTAGAGGWTIWQYVPSEEELAERVAASNGEQEARVCLDGAGELLTPELDKALLAKANQFLQQGAFKRALTILQLTVEAASRIDDVLSLATALRGLGVARDSLGDLQQALDCYDRALPLYQRIADNLGVAKTLNGLGNVQQHLGNYSESIQRYKESLKISQDLADNVMIAGVLGNLGMSLKVQANFQEAIECYERALNIAKEIGDRPGIARNLGNIAGVQTDRGEYEEALRNYESSLAMEESLGDRISMGRVIRNIGVVEGQRGNRERALKRFEESLRIAEEGGDKFGIAYALNSIAITRSIEGDQPRALESYQRCLKIMEEMGNKAGMATALGNIGILHNKQGNYPQALEYGRRSLAISTQIGDKPNIASQLTNIGVAYTNEGSYEPALEYLERSLKLEEEIDDRRGMASSMLNISNALVGTRSYDRALQYAQRSLGIARTIGAQGDAGDALSAIAAIRISNGAYADAIDAGRESVSIAVRVGDPDSLAKALTTLGKAYRAVGTVDSARECFARAIEVVEQMRGQVVGPEQERLRFLGSRVEPYHAMADLLVEQGHPPTALEFAERARARTLIEVLQAGRLGATKAMSEEEKAREQSLYSALVSLNTQITREKLHKDPDQNRLTLLADKLQKARLEYEGFQTDLYATHPSLKVQRGRMEIPDLAEARAVLPDTSTAVLEFLVLEERAYLFVIAVAPTPRGRPTLRVYTIHAGRKEISDLVDDFRKRLAGRYPGVRTAARKMYGLLLGPARAELHRKTTLCVVPDGSLWDVPFQCLITDAGRYLLQDSAVFYAPSISALLQMGKASQSVPTPKKPGATAAQPGPAAEHTSDPGTSSERPERSLLAIGDPSLSARTAEAVFATHRDETLDALPDAELEVKALAQIYGPQRSMILIGPAAQEQTVKAEAPHYRVLHFATHGILDDRNPMYSHLVLSQNADDSRQDGLLEAWEIMNLDLSARLAVLSACQTGRGQVTAGEGLIGMAWAFFVAGVPTTVVSQWKVESASTSQLMIAFHQNLVFRRDTSGRRLSTSQALRLAQLKLLESPAYSHPFYWAGFVVMGKN